MGHHRIARAVGSAGAAARTAGRAATKATQAAGIQRVPEDWWESWPGILTLWGIAIVGLAIGGAL